MWWLLKVSTSSKISTVLDAGDRQMIEDLTAAAVNAALESAQRMVQEELQRASAELALQGPDASEPS